MLHAQNTLWANASCMCMESTSHHAMLEIGYVCISADHCIYMSNTPKGSSIIAVHVDDMAAAASDKAEMARLKEELGELFSLVDLGELK